MSESFVEQLSRVQLMASGDPTWDLSDNDCAALKTVVDALLKMTAEASLAAQPLDTTRLVDQATAISLMLSNAGIGPCTIQVGVEEIIRQRDQLREVAQPLDWQPIETAPKDGSRVLTRAQNGAGFWCDPSVLYFRNGTWRTSPESDPLLTVYHPPKVWMPLPAPPAAHAASTEPPAAVPQENK